MVEVGQIISGKYKLLRLLGDGGMGSVFEAEHMNLGTHVAIKVLHTDLARKAGIAERFLQEARVSAQIRSPHVVQVIDVDRTPDGVAYLVMELLQGEPLSGLVRRERQLAVPTAAEYTTQILQALEAAHALGVIHRDLKPDNVFVTWQGGKAVLKLIDFGIAKLKTAQAGQTKNLTVAGMLMGTPEYMAPEQAYAADKVDVRADIYAVGVMLYEMLAGRPPVQADDPRVLVLKVERGEVPPLVQVAPTVPPEVAGFVHRAMAPRPEVRFATATEMRVALEEIVSGKRGTAKIVAQPQHTQQAPAVANPFAQTADANHPPAPVGTGTLMGAPADAVLGGSGPPPPMGHMPNMGPPMHAAPYIAPSSYEAQRPRKSGNGLIIVLAIGALLLGAGAVVLWVTTQSSSSSPPVATSDPTLTTAPTTPATTPTPTTTATTTSVTPVTPLNTPATVTPTPPATTPTVKKDAGAPAQPDAGTGPAPAAEDAGTPQTTIQTPFGPVQIPGPRPVWWPPGQPWPPPAPTLPPPVLPGQ